MCCRRRWASTNAALGAMALHRFSGRERSLCDLVLLGSLDFSDVDVSSAPRMAVRKELDKTRIWDLHRLVSPTTQSAARIPTAPTIFG